MLKLAILISKYLYIGYISLFLIFSWGYVLEERGLSNSRVKYSMHQFNLILAFNITTYIIMYLSGMKSGIGNFGFMVTLSIIMIIFKLLSKKFFEGSCPILWNSVLFLINLGVIIICRIDYVLGLKQLIFATLGLIVALMMPMILRLIPKIEILGLIYLVVMFGLVLLPFFYKESQGGSLNWSYITIFNRRITFQPSELAKIVYIFFLSSLFRKQNSKFKIGLATITSATLVIILVIQKDLGTALIYFMTYITLLYVGTGNITLSGLAIVLASVGSFVAYKGFPHVAVRIDSWKNPLSDPFGGGYQVLQSLFSMGTYGYLGSGLGEGYPEIVPVVESDFIYSAIGEELGGIFAILLIVIYILIFYRIANIALRSNKKFNSLVVVGIGSLLYVQTTLIIGGVMGILPLTGVTLPLISAGGSSLIITIIMISIVQWIQRNNMIEKKLEIEEVKKHREYIIEHRNRELFEKDIKAYKGVVSEESEE